MQIQPGTQKVQNRGRETNHGPIHGSPQNVENLQTGYRGLTNMANRGPRERGFKSDSLFHSTNGGCLLPGKGVWAFKTFRFSMGTLEAPVITNSERNGWTVTLNWENGIDCPKASASDQVFVGYFYDTLRRSPCLLRDIPARRGDESVTIEIPPGTNRKDTTTSLFIFWRQRTRPIFTQRVHPSIKSTERTTVPGISATARSRRPRAIPAYPRDNGSSPDKDGLFPCIPRPAPLHRQSHWPACELPSYRTPSSGSPGYDRKSCG